MDNYTDLNAKVIDAWAKEGWAWSIPISHETYLKALEGDGKIYLTPTKPVPDKWLGNIKGKKVLGLASGGGQQMPILSAFGAKCTVLDYSSEQIEAEKMVAEREGYSIEIVRADMTKRLPFEDGSFDMIIHPVSNVYVEEVMPIWKECFRVLKPGGFLLSGLDNGMNFIVDEKEERIVNRLPFNPLRNPDQSLPEDEGIQFSHTMEEQIRGQIKAGFQILDLYEDTNGEGRLHELNIPSFWATLAKKINK